MTTVGKLYGRAFGRIGISWSRRWRYKRIVTILSSKANQVLCSLLENPADFLGECLGKSGKAKEDPCD